MDLNQNEETTPNGSESIIKPNNENEVILNFNFLKIFIQYKKISNYQFILKEFRKTIQS